MLHQLHHYLHAVRTVWRIILYRYYSHITIGSLVFYACMPACHSCTMRLVQACSSSHPNCISSPTTAGSSTLTCGTNVSVLVHACLHGKRMHHACMCTARLPAPDLYPDAPSSRGRSSSGNLHAIVCAAAAPTTDMYRNTHYTACQPAHYSTS